MAHTKEHARKARFLADARSWLRHDFPEENAETIRQWAEDEWHEAGEMDAAFERMGGQGVHPGHQRPY